MAWCDVHDCPESICEEYSHEVEYNPSCGCEQCCIFRRALRKIREEKSQEISRGKK